jgi:transposase-like protein
LKTRVHYPEETKWKVIEMEKDGYSNCTIMEKLGIKNVSQIKRWMKWYRTDQTYLSIHKRKQKYPTQLCDRVC